MNKSKEILLSPKLKREIVLAERFILRLKLKKEIPFRTLVMMGKRLGVLHRKIQVFIKKEYVPELSSIKEDINQALEEIAGVKVRYEQKLKTKKKVRTFGDSMMNRKKKSYRK